MDGMASVGEELVFFALSLGLMQFALSRRPGGLFGALPWGLLPALVFAVAQFVVLQQPKLPEVQAARVLWAEATQKLEAQQLPGKDQAEERAALDEICSRLFEVQPGGEFCLIMVPMALLAAYLRRRQARRGLAPDPGPLSRWSAPWGLVWLVLAPLFWLVASGQGVVDGPAWGDHAALNVLTLGLVIFLFQGLVVVGAKLAGWSRNPRTRVMAVLCVLLLILCLVLPNHGSMLPLFCTLIVVGLLEPWVDLRHLKPRGAPPSGA
jgi:hypothetical protein